MFSGIGTPRWIAVRNDSGETAPAFAVLRITGSAVVEGRTVITVGKPDDTSTAVLLLNGPVDVAAGKYGQATPGPSFALYDDAETPAFSERWGTADGSWELEQDAPGAIVMGPPTLGRVLVSLTSLAKNYGDLSGDGEETITDGDWTKLTVLDGEPAEAFGMVVSTANHDITVLRDGAYYVTFFASAEAKTISVDSPDNDRPEIALFVNGSRYDSTVGSTIRLKTGANRSLAFNCVVDAVGGDVLDVRVQSATGNEIQKVTITGSPSGGTFTLTFDGQTTSAISYNGSAASVQSALEALSNISVGDVTCTGGPLPGTAVDVEFAGNFENQNVPQMTATSSLTGGTSPAVSVTTNSGPDNIVFDQCNWTVNGIGGAA